MNFIKKNKKQILAAAIAGLITSAVLNAWNYNRMSRFLLSLSASLMVFQNIRNRGESISKERERYEVPGCEYLLVDIEGKDPNIGIIKYTKEIEKNPEDIASLTKRGVCLSILDRHTEAIKNFEAALAINPTHKAALSYRAASLGAMGDLEGSVEGYKSLLNLNRKDFNALASIGVICYMQEKYAEAAEFLDKALEIDQEESSLYVARGNSNYYLGNLKEAIEDFEELERRDNTNIQVIYCLALAESSAGNTERAIEKMTKAINQSQGVNNALINARAELHFNLKDYNESIKDAATSITKDPEDTQALQIRGTARRMQGEYEKAVIDFDKIIEIEPENQNAFLRRGECHEHLGDLEKAIQDYSNYIELNPNEITGYYFKSNALLHLKYNHEAIDNINKWLSINSNSSEAYFMRSKAWRALNDIEKAHSDECSGIFYRGLLNKEKGNVIEAAKDLEEAFRMGERAAAEHIKEILKDSLIHENIYICIHSAASSTGETVDQLIERINSMSAEEMLEDAGINSEENPDENSSYHSLPNFLKDFSFIEGWWKSVYCWDIYLRIIASQWTSGLGEEWSAKAFQLLDDLFFRCGGRANMYKLIGLAIKENEEGLIKFLRVVNSGHTSTFNQWQLEVPYAFRDLKRDTLILLDKKVPIKQDLFDGVFEKDDQDADYFLNILNNRILDLWEFTDWGKSGMAVPNGLRSGKDIKNASWFHPEGTADDLKKESCFYYIYPDGIAVVREHNEYLDLKDDSQVQSGALTIIRDIMGEYDIDFVSDNFYKALLQSNVNGCTSNTTKDAYKDAFEKFQAGDYVAAIAAYDAAIKNRPQDAILYNSRGAAKRQSGDRQGAIDDYSKAIEINPQYEEAFINRGMAKSYLEDAKGAELDFSRAIEINPKNAVAYYNRGVVRHDMKDEQGAISDWSTAIDLNPEYADAYLNRGITKEAIGDLKGACADWQKAVDLGLKQPAIWIDKQCKKI